MSFASPIRGLAVVSIAAVSVAVLGWTSAELRGLRELRSEVAEAPALVRRIQELGVEVSALQQLGAKRSGDLFREDPVDFVTKILEDQNVALGLARVSLEEPEEPDGPDGLDRQIRIHAESSSLSNYGNLLYLLETSTPALAISTVDIRWADDIWTLELRICQPEAR